MNMKRDFYLEVRGAFSNFCSFVFKARSTTLIFVVCITFHQTSLLDDVQKVLAVFTGHKLCIWYVFGGPLIYWNTADLVLHWHWNYLPERSSCDLENNKNSQVQDIAIIWFVAARKLCPLVDSHIKIWSCTMFYKICHLTLLRLQHHFGTILTIFAKF